MRSKIAEEILSNLPKYPESIESYDIYEKYLKRLEDVFDAKIGTKESDEADILASLIDDYEKKNNYII